MRQSKREGSFLLAILGAALLAAFIGRAFAGDFTRSAQIIPPIATEYGSNLLIDGGAILININTDDPELLMTLPGIGSALSERILAYRAENGDFTEIDQLLEIHGLGTGTFDRLRGLIFAHSLS